jgi:hypothetical protein
MGQKGATLGHDERRRHLPSRRTGHRGARRRSLDTVGHRRRRTRRWSRSAIGLRSDTCWRVSVPVVVHAGREVQYLRCRGCRQRHCYVVDREELEVTYTTKQLFVTAIGYTIGVLIGMALFHTDADDVFAQIWGAFSFIGVAWASRKMAR